MSVWYGSIIESEVIGDNRVVAYVTNWQFLPSGHPTALPQGFGTVEVRECGTTNWSAYSLTEYGWSRENLFDGRAKITTGPIPFVFVAGKNYEFRWTGSQERSPYMPFPISWQARGTFTDGVQTAFETAHVVTKQLDCLTWDSDSTGDDDPDYARKKVIIIRGSKLNRIMAVRAVKATALGISPEMSLTHEIMDNGDLKVSWPRIETDQHGLYQLRFYLSDQASSLYTMALLVDRYFPTPNVPSNSAHLNPLGSDDMGKKNVPMEARYFSNTRTLVCEYRNYDNGRIPYLTYIDCRSITGGPTLVLTDVTRVVTDRYVFIYGIDIPGLVGSMMLASRWAFGAGGVATTFDTPLSLAFDDQLVVTAIGEGRPVVDNAFEFKQVYVSELSWWQYASNEPNAPHLGEPDNTDYAYPLNPIRNYQTVRRVVTTGYGLGPVHRVTNLTATKAGASGQRSSGGITEIIDKPETDLRPERRYDVSWGIPTEYWSYSNPEGLFSTKFTVTGANSDFLIAHAVIRIYRMVDPSDVYGRFRLNGATRPTGPSEIISERHGIPRVKADPFAVSTNLVHDTFSSSWSSAVTSLLYGTDFTIVPTVEGVKLVKTGVQTRAVYEEVHTDNLGGVSVFAIQQAAIVSMQLAKGHTVWTGGFVFELLRDYIDDVNGVIFRRGWTDDAGVFHVNRFPCVYDGVGSTLTLTSFSGDGRINGPVVIPGRGKPRGGGCRKIDLRSWVPEYLKAEGFEELVGSFETYLNEMFEGPCINDPTQLKVSILQKIEDMSDLLDPNRVPVKLLHHLARNMGFDVANSILRASDLGDGPADLRRYARMLIDSLPDIIRTKTTKDSMRGMMFCVGALANIYYAWSNGYSASDERDWVYSNENDLDDNLPLVAQQIDNKDFGPTPHFSLDIDLTRYDLTTGVGEITDLMVRAMEMIEAIRPVNTVIDRLAVSIPVEIDDSAMTAVFVRGWADSPYNANPVSRPVRITVADTYDEGDGVLEAPHAATIDELGGVIAPLEDSIVQPDGLI